MSRASKVKPHACTARCQYFNSRSVAAKSRILLPHASYESSSGPLWRRESARGENNKTTVHPKMIAYRQTVPAYYSRSLSNKMPTQHTSLPMDGASTSAVTARNDQPSFDFNMSR